MPNIPMPSYQYTLMTTLVDHYSLHIDTILSPDSTYTDNIL